MFLSKIRVSIAKLILPILYKFLQMLKSNTRAINFLTNKKIYANNSVIVSCGAIKSPQLLMLSGIGPSEHLSSMGIKTSVNLKGVGENLQDHLLVATGFECTKNVTIHKITQPHQKFYAGLKWLLTRKGIVASNIWEMGGQVFSNHKAKYPNLQYHFAPAFNEYDGRKIILSQGFLLQCDQLRPKSKGRVRLKTNNPSVSPVSYTHLTLPTKRIV